MKLEKYRIEAIKVARLRLEQARWPDQEISLTIKTTTDAHGGIEEVVTRFPKAD